MAGVAATAVRVRASAAGRIRRMAYASARARKSEGASGLANGLGPDKPSRHRGIAPRPSEHCDPASCSVPRRMEAVAPPVGEGELLGGRKGQRVAAAKRADGGVLSPLVRAACERREGFKADRRGLRL